MRGWLTLISILLTASICRPQVILDRLAASVGLHAITESDILKEIRLSAFLDGSKADFSAENRRRTAERLVERVLVLEEMQLGNYPAPAEAEVDAQLQAVRKQKFASREEYEEAMRRAGVSEPELREHLSELLAVMRFIDARFGPGVQLTDEEIEQYYSREFTRQWQLRSKQPPPPFEEVRAEIGEALRAERVNLLLDQWLKEAKSRVRIQFIPEAFR